MRDWEGTPGTYTGPHELDDLSVRTRNCLYRGGYFLRATVAATPDDDLLGVVKNLGVVTLAEIRAAIPYQPVETRAQLLNSGPIAITVTPAPASYTSALAPVLDSDWAYARAQMGLPGTDPPQAPGGVYAQLTALAGHVARLQARLDTQEALLLDVTARLNRIAAGCCDHQWEGHMVSDPLEWVEICARCGTRR